MDNEYSRRAKSHDLERQSSSDSYESTSEERQTANWIEVRLIGSGGFGNVTLWRNKADNAHLVIKECRIPEHLLQVKGMEQRWHNEIKLLSKLRHQNITTARQADEREFARALSFPFLCMEYCEGGDLRQVLRQVDHCCGLQEKQIKEICKDVAAGIKYLHQEHIVHRDLKPENILLKSCNGKIVYKLTDFGYAKQYTQSSMCTSFVGTMQYVAPEILQNRSYNKDVDFWSCGIVVYECITGRRPFLPWDSPMQWLVHVEKKKPQHIAVDWAESGTTVCYYDTLPAHHRLSRVFEQGITYWLQLMLRWKPQERGGQEVSPGEREWFNRLQEILSTKVIFVVCMCTSDIYSYDVTEVDRNMDRIKQAIMVDTGIEVDQQMLLTHDGCLVTRMDNPNTKATMDGCSHDNTFYLFTDSQVTSIRLVKKQSGYINRLITNNDEHMGLSERRCCYGAMYSMMRDKACNFSQLLSGQQALIVYVNKLLDNRKVQIGHLNIAHSKTQAKIEFLKKMHQGDAKSLSAVAQADSVLQETAKRILSSWRRSEENIDYYEHNLEQLLSDHNDISSHLTTVQVGIEQLDQSNHSISASLKQFEAQCVNEAKKQLELVKYADRLDELPKDNVNQAHNVLMMSSKQCDDLINQFNENSGTKIAMVVLPKLDNQLHKLKDKLTNLNVQIDSLQERHQADIWRLVEQKATTPPPDVNTSFPNDGLNDSQSAIVQVSSSVEQSLITFKSQVSIEVNDHVISTNNDLVKKLEDLSSALNQQQVDMASSLQNLN